MKDKLLFLGVLGMLFISTLNIKAQKRNKGICIAFYNLENLFDTQDDPEIRDEEYLPSSEKAYTPERYNHKLNNLATVIDSIRFYAGTKSVDILGVCEVENRTVLEDLVAIDKLRKNNFGIVHYNSPDKRGIDVGLLYNRASFKVENSKAYPLIIEGKSNFYTRDQLLVSGLLKKEKTHIIVNHWPSRYGGEEKSRPNRNAAARLTRYIVDSLQALNDGSKIIVMGDFNDDPTNQSIAEILDASKNVTHFAEGGLYNPLQEIHRPKDFGSLCYRGYWNMFDQIIISPEYLIAGNKKHTFASAHVMNKEFLRVQEGNYTGYPKRSYVRNDYHGGYSDHFPVYIVLKK